MWREAKTIRSRGQEALRQALVDARIMSGHSQRDLAEKLKQHQSFVARVESGERRIEVVEILAIIEAATEPDHRI